MLAIAASGDALIRQSEPAKNFGASQALTTSSGAAGIRHALVRFDLSGVPEGADVISASLVLHGLLYSGGSIVHPVVTPWDQATVNWLTLAAAPLLPAVAALPSINAGGVASADVRAPSTGPDALNCICNNREWIALCANLDCSSGMAQDEICVPACGGKCGLWGTGCIDNSPVCSGN